MFANLHLHSTFSDAGFMPYQLVRIAKSLGYKALALTDHETDAGCVELMEEAVKEGMDSVTGCEFYGKTASGKLTHLTALDFDQNNPTLRNYIRERCQMQYEFTRICVERGIRMGIIQGITWDEIESFAGNGAWLCIDSVLRIFRTKHLPIPEDFRTLVFKAPEVLEFKPKFPTAETVIRAVRNAGGVIGLAHPEGIVDFVEELVSYGLNGIEISHPDISEKTIQLATQAAETFHLYRLGGTDHTGALSDNGGKLAIVTDHGISEEDYYRMKNRAK